MACTGKHGEDTVRPDSHWTPDCRDGLRFATHIQDKGDPMSRKPRIVAAVAALSIALAACGGGSSSSSSASSGSDTGDGAATEIETADPTFQPISAGKLTVCSDVPYPPFEFQDDAGKWTGFDIDVISAVAQRYGLTVEVSRSEEHTSELQSH